MIKWSYSWIKDSVSICWKSTKYQTLCRCWGWWRNGSDPSPYPQACFICEKTNNYNTFETGAIFNVWTELQATLRQGKHRSRTVWFCLVKLGRATKRGGNIWAVTWKSRYSQAENRCQVEASQAKRKVRGKSEVCWGQVVWCGWSPGYRSGKRRRCLWRDR